MSKYAIKNRVKSFTWTSNERKFNIVPHTANPNSESKLILFFAGFTNNIRCNISPWLMEKK